MYDTARSNRGHGYRVPAYGHGDQGYRTYYRGSKNSKSAGSDDDGDDDENRAGAATPAGRDTKLVATPGAVAGR